VRLPRFELSLRDLLELKAGTIVPTGISKDARLVIRTGDQERFLGQAGRVAGNLAVRIVDHLSPSNG
jgi:flagellar motor switch protein FliM